MVIIAGYEEPTREDLLARLSTERAAWEGLVAQAGDLLTEPGLEGEWSLKDVIAHICASERFVVTALGGKVRPIPPMPPDVGMVTDRRNAWLHACDKDRAPAEVVAEANIVHALLVGQIGQRSQEALEQPLVEWNGWPIWRWVVMLGEHYAEHIPALHRRLELLMEGKPCSTSTQ